MKQILLGLVALVALTSSSGCHLLGRHKGCDPAVGCNDCGPGSRLHGRLGHHGAGHGGLHRGPHGHHQDMTDFGTPAVGGPPAAQVAYPYYTTRGPRDFLNPNPPSIGY